MREPQRCYQWSFKIFTWMKNEKQDSLARPACTAAKRHVVSCVWTAAHFFYNGKKKVVFSPVLALMMMVSLLLLPPTRNIDRWKQHARNPSVGTVQLIPGNMRSPTEVEEGAQCRRRKVCIPQIQYLITRWLLESIKHHTLTNDKHECR